MDSILVNATVPMDGALFKRRRAGRGWLIYAGNLFLRWSNSRIRMFPAPCEWQAWECHCYQTLYGGGCEPVGENALRVQPFPGESLRTLLENNILTDDVLRAAACEFRRAHALDGWSHGDPHLHNVIYDGQRAYLIDFETRHQHGLSAAERHADDLLVFLLDLIGRDPSEQWSAWSRIFLAAYDNSAVRGVLFARLAMPRGLELVLWKSRTNYFPTPHLAKRITALRALASKG